MSSQSYNISGSRTLTPERAGAVVRETLSRRQKRLAVVAEESTARAICAIVGAGQIPVLNIADGVKEEVVAWLASAQVAELTGDAAIERHFCDYLGFSESTIRAMDDFVRPVITAMQVLYAGARANRLDARAYNTFAAGEGVVAKVALVDRDWELFQFAIETYTPVVRDLTGDPYHWTDKVVARSIGQSTVLTGDLRFRQDLDTLSKCGWSSIYVGDPGLIIGDITANDCDYHAARGLDSVGTLLGIAAAIGPHLVVDA